MILEKAQKPSLPKSGGNTEGLKMPHILGSTPPVSPVL